MKGNLEKIVKQQSEQIAILTKLVGGVLVQNGLATQPEKMVQYASEVIRPSKAFFDNSINNLGIAESTPNQKEGAIMPYLKEGTIRKRNKGQQWEIRYYDNGKQKSVYHKNQAECVRLFHEAIKERDKRDRDLERFGAVRPDIQAKKFTLFSWLDEWMTKYKIGQVSKGWEASMKNVIKNHIKVHFRDCPMNDLTAFEIEACFEKIVSTKMRQDSYITLNMALNMAYKKDLMKYDIMSKVQKPKHERESRLAFPEHLQKSIMAYSKKNSKLHQYFLTYDNTGCRPDEIHRIKKCDFNFDGKTLFIDGTKTKGSKRTMPLFAPLFELREWLNAFADQDKVFTVSCDCLNDELRRILTAIGVANPMDYSLYSFRHTMHTRLNESGIDANTISKWLGNSPEIAQKVYIKVMPAHEQTQADLFNKRIA